MHNPPPPPQSPRPPPAPASDMESTSIWDWSQFLDFDIDDQLPASPTQSDYSQVIPTFEELPPFDNQPVIPVSDSFPVDSNSNNNDRVRKRDPRMTCPNFLAGLIPCACPELDAQLAAEEEQAGPGKKRAKTARLSTAERSRCQVPGCEADISGLKGYHKRHRVCLRCANASSVVLDGQNKRYCQQCGKFHLLADFDEGKRSCRRKLERHNNRRRRKPSDSKSSGERGLQSAEAERGDDEEAGKDSSETAGETLLSAGESIHAQNSQKENTASFAAPSETQTDEEKEKISPSPSYCDDKVAFSSACPTGRISFKLYDWNPAEFPRRLRHQIFQWLGSMPVELEGYIRPGCTILTLFISMPSFMWMQLVGDPVVRIGNLLASPRSMLAGRGTFFVRLNDMVFRVMEDGMSVIKVKVEEHAPKLHYVHPTCFEAGKPMELLVCGSNLLQPKHRFLVSFGGKYLTNDISASSVGSKTGHQLLNICVPHTELESFGPGFIEVENESGLSNFIPVLIADEEICSEVNEMQMKFYSTSQSRDSLSAAMSISCEVAVSRQSKFSELLLDMAWLLREPVVDDMGYAMTASQLQRFTWVLNFLIEHDSTTVLKRILHCMKMRIDKGPAISVFEADRSLFLETMNHATEVLGERLEKSVKVVLQGNEHSSRGRLIPSVPTESKLDALVGVTSANDNEAVPLLNTDCVMSVRVCKEQVERSSGHMVFASSNRFFTYRPLVFVIASAAVCFGICAVVFLPQKATGIATTIRRCLFNHNSS